ncbi:MAG: GntR family transcriptional regulator [Propionibacteriaceae bacterium]|nr:GntR family transcriptional regulator [Propionibacteriaceae bacterium]
MSLSVVISNSSGMPIYEQIKEQVKTSILDGDLAEGEPLPSIRQMASDLRVAVMTTTRAYSELESEGFLVTVQGKGSFVAPIDNQLVREQMLRRIEDAMSAAVTAARLAGVTKPELFEILNFILEGANND